MSILHHFFTPLSRDYAARPELDRYDPAMIDDDSTIPQLRPSERRIVESILDNRDRRQAERGRSLEGDGRRRNHESRAYHGLRDLVGNTDEGELALSTSAEGRGDKRRKGELWKSSAKGGKQVIGGYKRNI